MSSTFYDEMSSYYHLNSQAFKRSFMIVEYLADHREFLPEIAELVFAEWKDLYTINGVDLDKIEAILIQRAVKHGIPYGRRSLDVVVLLRYYFYRRGK